MGDGLAPAAGVSLDGPSGFAGLGLRVVELPVSPLHTWPAHIVDVKRALAWVKENIAAYGGDPDFVAISGGSAGGHLSALAALTPNEPRFQPVSNMPTPRWSQRFPSTGATTGIPPTQPGDPNSSGCSKDLW
ncbi:alpha/beta hydrolase fold family protein [Mycobacterium kansasii]|uniref:Alpha/beta hydrolase fold family protein n=1 Tax=Mycobacterium kansasii TaxID=1768 RepID=A0A1V3WDJ8_MYCKA|nr:alpha/beta hydrolase fold family protein [Mycobacterium kansasii]